MARHKFNVLPGFGLTMGFTLFYLSAIVLIPFVGLVIRTLELSWADFWRLATRASVRGRAAGAYGGGLGVPFSPNVVSLFLARAGRLYPPPHRTFRHAVAKLRQPFGDEEWLRALLIPDFGSLHRPFSSLGLARSRRGSIVQNRSDLSHMSERMLAGEPSSSS